MNCLNVSVEGLSFKSSAFHSSFNLDLTLGIKYSKSLSEFNLEDTIDYGTLSKHLQIIVDFGKNFKEPKLLSLIYSYVDQLHLVFPFQFLSKELTITINEPEGKERLSEIPSGTSAITVERSLKGCSIGEKESILILEGALVSNSGKTYKKGSWISSLNTVNSYSAKGIFLRISKKVISSTN